MSFLLMSEAPDQLFKKTRSGSVWEHSGAAVDEQLGTPQRTRPVAGGGGAAFISSRGPQGRSVVQDSWAEMRPGVRSVSKTLA